MKQAQERDIRNEAVTEAFRALFYGALLFIAGAFLERRLLRKVVMHVNARLAGVPNAKAND